MGFTINGYLALLHTFEQAGLCARYGAVDFVGKQHVGDHRARSKRK